MTAIEKYNCLVVDDEPIARKIIINYIDQLPLLQLSSACINAFNAIDHLRTDKGIDIIFLDVNMPNLSGLQLLKIVQPLQPVIFTTAYAEHAVESYDLNAVDYLLKPFSFERFTKAVFKAIDAIKKAERKMQPEDEGRKPDLFIKSDGKTFPAFINEILYCEARKNYTMVTLANGQKLMPLIALSKMQQMLSDAGGQFIQVHRSFVVAKKYISSITSSSVLVGQSEIPIGTQFKQKFFQFMGIRNDEDNGF